MATLRSIAAKRRCGLGPAALCSQRCHPPLSRRLTSLVRDLLAGEPSSLPAWAGRPSAGAALAH